MGTISKACKFIAESKLFMRLVLIVILFNTVLVGLETSTQLFAQYETLFHILDQWILVIFTLEIVIKFIASQFSWRFFRDPWNVFDFIIVLFGYLLVSSPYVTLLRIVRVFRIFRAVSVVPSLKKLTNALILTLPSLGTIVMFMGIIFYVFAVLGTLLFRDVAPAYFGSLPLSFLTLFQVVTLEAWASDVMRPVMALQPFSWIYFVIFVLLGTFVVLNLIVGVIVSNVERANQEEMHEEESERQEHTQKELAQIRKELEEIKQLLNKSDK